jgi:hypothetical protein
MIYDRKTGSMVSRTPKKATPETRQAVSSRVDGESHYSPEGD